MNQTVTANVSGIVFHIEVNAYESLNSYLNKIKSYFVNAEESEEIMADIEARIAEIFTSKITSENQVISNKDVEDVIEIMGKPEQYVDGEDTSSYDSNGPSANARASREHKNPRRLFRDPDHRILGGVASGIGTYFGIDPVWIRLLFVVALFMGFGFLFYIILWIVIPEARTAAEKLQMKGEPVNIENIGKSFEEGAKKVNDKIKNTDMGEFGKRIESFLHSVFHFIGTILKGLFKAIGKVLGFFLLLLGVFLAFFFVGNLFGSDIVFSITRHGVFSFDSFEFFTSLFSSSLQYRLASIGVLLALGIPILSLLLIGIKVLFNVKGRYGVGMALGMIWFIGLVLCAAVGIGLASEFKTRSESTETFKVQGDYRQLVLRMDESNIPGEQVINVEDDDFFLTMDERNIYYGYPTLDIQKSKGDSAYVSIVKNAQGRSKKDAIENAQSIEYFVIQENDALTFNSFLEFSKKNRIRGQEVQLTLYIPVGMTIYMDPSLENLIYNIENVSDTWDRDMLGEKWIMLKKGLNCLDCLEIEGVMSEELKLVN